MAARNTGFASENISIVLTSHAKRSTAEEASVAVGTTVRQLFMQTEGSSADPSKYTIKVNGAAPVASYVLKAGDRVTFTPSNVKGA